MNAMTPIRQPRYAYTILVWMASLPILVASPAAAGQARAVDLYVSLQGNDAWSGRQAEPNAAKTDGPLATIEHAQQLVRQLKGQRRPHDADRRGHSRRDLLPLQADPLRPRGFRHGRKSPIVYQAYGQERPDPQRRREAGRLAGRVPTAAGTRRWRTSRAGNGRSPSSS